MFWNVYGGTALPLVSQACIEQDVDILVLAEDCADTVTTTNYVNTLASNPYKPIYAALSPIRIYARASAGSISIVSDASKRSSIREITTPRGGKILLVAVHLISYHTTDIPSTRT